MADPLSIIGVGLGAASLILQITDECIKSLSLPTPILLAVTNYSRI